MPWSGNGDEYPSRNDVVQYLKDYESRYALNVLRGVRVLSVERNQSASHPLRVRTSSGDWTTKAVISATGGEPFIPNVPGRNDFRGIQLHSLEYSSPDAFRGKRVVVVGGGNSGAQIVAELTEPDSGVAHVTWATLQPPSYLPDQIDGRYLFEQATERYKAEKEGRPPAPPRSLGEVVMVQPVRAARDRGTLIAVRMFERLDSSGAYWPDGTHTAEDIIIWATGFRPALSHLEKLGVNTGTGRVEVSGAAGTRSVSEPRLWLVGYGNWTGYASATLIGVGRSARATVQEVREALRSDTC